MNGIEGDAWDGAGGEGGQWKSLTGKDRADRRRGAH